MENFQMSVQMKNLLCKHRNFLLTKKQGPIMFAHKTLQAKDKKVHTKDICAILYERATAFLST